MVKRNFSPLKELTVKQFQKQKAVQLIEAGLDYEVMNI